MLCFDRDCEELNNKLELLFLLKGLSKCAWGLSKVDIPNANGNIWRNFVLRVVKVDIDMETFRKMSFESCQSWVWNGKKTTFMEVIVFWDLSKSNTQNLSTIFPQGFKQIWHRNWEQLADFIQCWVE